MSSADADRTRSTRPLPLVALLCTGQVLGMSGFATFATLLPAFTREWSLSGTAAGWISAGYYVGYVAAVAVLVSLTDRVDARRIYLFGLLVSGLSSVAYALLADGFWSALLLRCVAGVGLAGTYMPGLRVLGDRLDGAAQLRAVPWYTGFFSVGTSVSFLLAEWVAGRGDWRDAFLVAGVLPLVAAVLVWLRVEPRAPAAPTERRALLDFRPVLRDRRLLGWCLMYGGHTWELLALRAWLVAFLVFSLGLQPAGGDHWEPGLVTAVIVLAGMPASVLTAEFALRRERLVVIRRVMAASMLLAVAFGASAALPYPLVVALALLYNTVVMADSGSITAGAVHATPVGLRGALLAVYSLIGFSGGIAGPLLAGMVLDAAGGAGSSTAWLAAMATIGAGSLLALLAVPLAARRAD